MPVELKAEIVSKVSHQGKAEQAPKEILPAEQPPDEHPGQPDRLARLLNPIAQE
jgi:hypothetical protein